MNRFTIVAILGLLLGITSQLQIWPGPLLIRHLAPGIVSGILIIAACLGASKSGSKIVGIIAIIYGILASLVAFNIVRLLTITVATIFGIIIALIVGIAVESRILSLFFTKVRVT